MIGFALFPWGHEFPDLFEISKTSMHERDVATTYQEG
jgi:hypothetical protein